LNLPAVVPCCPWFPDTANLSPPPPWASCR
jgi:hypothetical protein